MKPEKTVLFWIVFVQAEQHKKYKLWFSAKLPHLSRRHSSRWIIRFARENQFDPHSSRAVIHIYITLVQPRTRQHSTFSIYTVNSNHWIVLVIELSFSSYGSIECVTLMLLTGRLFCRVCPSGWRSASSKPLRGTFRSLSMEVVAIVLHVLQSWCNDPFPLILNVD